MGNWCGVTAVFGATLGESMGELLWSYSSFRPYAGAEPGELVWSYGSCRPYAGAEHGELVWSYGSFRALRWGRAWGN